MIETIAETTMGNLGTVPTGMASMGMGAYTLPDGSEAHGMSCVLAPADEENVIVGLGSVVDIQGVSWEVIGIEKNRGELGSITLRRQGSGDGSSLPSERLDFRFSTSCPACGERAGWNGSMDVELDETVMCMECVGCSNEFVWYNGALAELLRVAPPLFIPGAGASE